MNPQPLGWFGIFRLDCTKAEHTHATDDPRRTASADIRAVAESRPENLHEIMQRYESTGDHRRQR
jgi:hypothetical protein